VKWQAGTPFTADDLAFAFSVYKDPEIPTQIGRVLQLMTGVEVADPTTLVVHWSAIYVEADAAFGLVPLPRHLMEPLYRTDKASFSNSPLLSTEFVGLGAYKLSRWEPGTQIEFVRFDDYYMGRPPLDTIQVRFLNDPNVMAAAILAESVDVLLPTSVDIEAAVEIKRRWEGTGNQVQVLPNGAMILLLIQHRPDYARPRNGFTNRLVRQGFLNATDREAVAEIAVVGLGPVADGWFPPTHELYPQLKDAIPQYPYDLNLAQQRLAQAGWVRNAQGELISQQTGERFEVELRTPPGLAGEKTLATTADGWSKVGAKTEFNLVPAALASDAEYRVTLPGLSVTGQIFDQFYQDALDSRQIGNAANRWVGANRAGYSNSQLDELYDKLAVAIAPADRLVVHRAMLQEAMGDVAFFPLYWQLAPVLALKGVHGIRGTIDNSNTWNVFEWTKD
jgi:peptide/nickel transport system substrate-binding protein